MQEEIREYLNINSNASPYDLVRDILPKYYPVTDLVLDAAKYFTTIIRRKDICIEQEMLNKYNVITTNNKSSDIIRMFKQYNFVEGRDYNLRNVAQVRKK